MNFPTEASLKPSEEGHGLKSEPIPRISHFDKLFIMTKKLYYDNILSVKQGKSLASIPQLSATRVGDRMVHILMNLLNNTSPTNQELQMLPTDEQILYDRLIYLAGFNKSIIHNQSNSVAQLKKRLKLIHGEIGCGNDNPALKSELHQIVHTLYNLKNIPYKEMNSYLSQFK